MNISNIKTIYSQTPTYYLDDIRKEFGTKAAETFVGLKSNITSLEKDLSKISIRDNGTRYDWTCIKKDELTFEINFNKNYHGHLNGTLTRLSDTEIYFEFSKDFLERLVDITTYDRNHSVECQKRTEFTKKTLSLLLTYIMIYENKSFFSDKFNLTNA